MITLRSADRSYTQEVGRSMARLGQYLDAGRRVVASSSFQTHSIPMLVIVAEMGSIPVYFLDTGYHFPETLTYRDRIADLLDLDVRSVGSPVTKLAQRSPCGALLFTRDPDHCCHLNKTVPMEAVVAGCDVWVSGVRRTQNTNRATFETEMAGTGGSVRYHPMLDWTDSMIDEFIRDHGLPAHPLDGEGYASISCAPCTQRVPDDADPRAGRWSGLEKTECGLHVDLVRR